jgi:hypothetical protein
VATEVDPVLVRLRSRLKLLFFLLIRLFKYSPGLSWPSARVIDAGCNPATTLRSCARVIDQQNRYAFKHASRSFPLNDSRRLLFFNRLSSPDEVESDATSIGPFIERARSELGAMIERDRLRLAMLADRVFQRLRNCTA